VKKYIDAFKGYHLAMQISGMLVCSVFGSLFGGIWLDRKLGTTPWLMLILMVLGLGFAMYNIIQIAKDNSR
jgi:ATP synthase protein I